MTRARPRKDGNQDAVVRALRDTPGVTVHSTAALGKGFPDLAVGFRGRSYLIELKDPAQPPSKRKLSEAEQAWHDTWTGHVVVATTAEQILREIGATSH